MKDKVRHLNEWMVYFTILYAESPATESRLDANAEGNTSKNKHQEGYSHLGIVVLLNGVALVEVQANGGHVVSRRASAVSGHLLLEIVHVCVNVLVLWGSLRSLRERKKK